jgi:hypothetical protein
VCVDEDMIKLNLGVMDIHDRAVWRSDIMGSRLTRGAAMMMTMMMISPNANN